MSSIGIPANVSLIEKRRMVESPFSIEFARSSSTRDGAPTVVPVESGGGPVHAAILVLDETVRLDRAEDLLWRRETRNEHSARHYSPPSQPSPNRMTVEKLSNFEGIDTVIYTKLGANIKDLSPSKLSDLAIRSAKAAAGKNGKDGISYLISLKRQGITTLLMPEYENEILRKTGSSDLEEALSICRKKAV